MRTWAAAVVVVCLLAGCSSSKEATETSHTSQGSRTRSLAGEHAYRVMNDGCACETYTVKDPRGPVVYEVSALYQIEEGITTTIHLTLQNRSDDTVQTSLATVKVSSRNVAYQYNNRSVPLTMEAVPPQQERKITMVGKATKTPDDPWLAMAGEELTLTVHGLTVGARRLTSQTITMVPLNPRFAE